MQLLSDYEDAMSALHQHALVSHGMAAEAESAHMVEATRLHAEVRRLRAEIYGLLIDTSAGAHPATS